MMVVGSLVQFIGDARFYKGRIGIVTQAFEGAVLVHFAGAAGQGRDEACAGQICNGLHPMGNDELKVLHAA